MHPGVQAALALNASQPCPRSATISLLGLDSGGKPPALAAYGHVEPAEVWVDGERVGQATVMGILARPLIDALWRTRIDWRHAVRAFDVWNCRALQARDWDELAQVDWLDAEPIDLPELTWRRELPAEGVALLSRAGITVEALCSTARL